MKAPDVRYAQSRGQIAFQVVGGGPLDLLYVPGWISHLDLYWERWEVLVSSTVRELVAGSGLRFEERGAVRLKGVEGEWRLHAAVGDEASPHAALT